MHPGFSYRQILAKQLNQQSSSNPQSSSKSLKKLYRQQQPSSGRLYQHHASPPSHLKSDPSIQNTHHIYQDQQQQQQQQQSQSQQQLQFYPNQLQMQQTQIRSSSYADLILKKKNLLSNNSPISAKSPASSKYPLPAGRQTTPVAQNYLQSTNTYLRKQQQQQQQQHDVGEDEEEYEDDDNQYYPLNQSYEEEKRKIASRKNKIIKQQENLQILTDRRKHTQQQSSSGKGRNNQFSSFFISEQQNSGRRIQPQNLSKSYEYAYLPQQAKPKRPMLSTLLDPPEHQSQPHYPEGRHHHNNQLNSSSYGSQTEQDLQLQDQIIERIAQRHPNAGVLMHSSRKVNWIQSISFDELKYLLKISQNDLKQTEVALAAEIKKREEAQNQAKRARYNMQRERAQNTKLEKQNDQLKEILESKEMALSKCLSQNLKLKDTIQHSLQLFKIMVQQSKKMIRKQQLIRAKKLQELGQRAIQNIEIVKQKVWDPEKINLFKKAQEAGDDKQFQDWGMIDEFLLNNGEYKIQEQTDDNFVLSLSQNQDVRQLTGNSQEILLTSLGKRAREEVDEDYEGNNGKVLGQSPSVTDTFSKLREDEKKGNVEVMQKNIQHHANQQQQSAGISPNAIQFLEQQQQQEEQQQESDGNLNESDIIIEQTPKAAKIIQSSGVSASHSFKPLAQAESGHLNSGSKQIQFLSNQTQEELQSKQELEESKLIDLKLSTQFSPPKQHFFSSESPEILNHISHSLGPNQQVSMQQQQQQYQDDNRQAAIQSAFFPKSPDINNKISIEGGDYHPLITSGDDSAAVIFANQRESKPFIKRQLELKLNNQITASAQLKQKKQQLQALKRENSLTKETISLTLDLERQRLKKQFVQEYERLKQGNNELKRSLKESKREYEKQLKSLLAQIKQKNQNIARVEKENNQIRKDHKSSRSAIKRVENSSSILQKQQQDLRKENIERNKDIQTARQQAEQMNMQNERLRQRLREARQQFSKLSSQMLNFGSDKQLKTPNLIAEVIDLRKKLEIQNESKQNISNKFDQELVAAQKEAKNLRQRIIQLMSQRSKLESEVGFFKNKEVQMQEEFHLKDVKLHQYQLKLEQSSQTEESLNKKLGKRIQMLKQVQQTNDHLSQTIRTLKKQTQQAAKAKAKAESDLYTAEKEKTQYGLSLERLQQQLQQVEHEKAHLSALVESQRKEHKQAGPLSTAVKQLSLIILNKTRKASDMKPEEKNLIKQVFDANIQGLLSQSQDKLTKSKANQRLLAQSLKTHVTNCTSYLSDISGMALSIQKLGKVLQRFGATDLPVEVALLRDEIVQQRAQMRSKAAFAEQEIKDLERQFKVLSTGMLVEHMDLGNVRDQENYQEGGKLAGNTEAMQQQLKQLLAKNEGGGPALLSENKKLMSEVDRLMKQNDRLNGQIIKLMQRNSGLMQREHEIARYQEEVEYMKSQLTEFQTLNKDLTKKLQSAVININVHATPTFQMASNQDLKILVSKMDNQRTSQNFDSNHKSLNRSKTKSDRSVGFFPAENNDAVEYEGISPIKSQLNRVVSPLQESLGRISPRNKQLDLSKQLNQTSILQLNVSQGPSIGINESDNQLLSLLHCQCSALEEIIQRKRNGASPKPGQSP